MCGRIDDQLRRSAVRLRRMLLRDGCDRKQQRQHQRSNGLKELHKRILLTRGLNRTRQVYQTGEQMSARQRENSARLLRASAAVPRITRQGQRKPEFVCELFLTRRDG